MSDNKGKAIAALMASGFPFQTAIANLVSSLENWSIHVEEYPWRDARGEDQFLDIIATRFPFVVTIECKKTQKETLTFLTFDDSTDNISGSLCSYTTQIQDLTRRLEVYFAWWYILPASFDSSFCVVSTSASGKDTRLLERDAQALIRGTDAFTAEYKETFKPQDFREADRPYIPLIVTNAPLFVASFDPNEISLETGQFKAVPSKISEVPWIRFTKTFTSTQRGKPFPRTVFVINALKLEEFLTTLQIEPGRPRTNFSHPKLPS